MPTISRLFADYSATALRLFRARAVPVRGRAARLDAKPGGRSAGGLRAVLARGQQAVPRTCRRGHERGAISKRRVQCLYLRRNYPLNARLCFKGIPIYPRHKRAVYARFRGVFRGVQKTPRECACIRQGGRYSGGRWSCSHSVMPGAGGRKKPRQAAACRGADYSGSTGFQPSPPAASSASAALMPSAYPLRSSNSTQSRTSSR